MSKFRQSFRAEAHETLDRLLDAAQRIERERDRKKKALLAWSCAFDFSSLSSHLSTICYAIEGGFYVPSSDPDNDEDFISIERWRQLVATLISNEIPLNRHMKNDLTAALLALNHGEVQQVLKPSVTFKKKPAWTISRLQLLAFIHVYCLHGQGYTVTHARERVAKAYGYHHEGGHNTIRSWATRDLLTEYDKSYLKWIKEVSAQLGALLKSGVDRSKMYTLETPAHALGSCMNHFDLETCGALYQKALRGEPIDVPFWLIGT